jgi:hypothetical protein
MTFLSPTSSAQSAATIESDSEIEAQPVDRADPGDSRPDIEEISSHAAGQEADLRLFAGANAEAFVRMAQSKAERSPGGSAICWPGFLLPVIWFLYRKMYGCAALTVLLPVFVSLFHPPVEAAEATGLVLSLFGAFGKRLYLAKARKTIAEIRAAAPDEATARETIVRAGGASRAGAVIGALLMVAFVAFAVLKT